MGDDEIEDQPRAAVTCRAELELHRWLVLPPQMARQIPAVQCLGLAMAIWPRRQPHDREHLVGAVAVDVGAACVARRKLRPILCADAFGRSRKVVLPELDAAAVARDERPAGDLER